jgi:hypothetical protein
MDATRQRKEYCSMDERKFHKNWLPFGIDEDDIEDKKRTIEELSSSMRLAHLDQEIAEIVAEEMVAGATDVKNLVFIFTDNDYVITAIHSSRDSIGGDGPFLMRGANEKSIIAAVSKEKIIEMLEYIDEEEETHGRDHAEQLWVAELEKLAEIIKLEVAMSPPEKWSSLLDNNS